jgi:carboxypeptidase family protein/PDZ domain-containing protein
MVKPVLSVWVYRRWPALLAGLVCAIFLSGLALLYFAQPQPDLPRIAAAAQATRLFGVSVDVEAEDCGADAGACSQSGESRLPGGSVARAAALAGARVRLLRDQEGYQMTFAEALTDGSGRARLEAPSGTFWLVVEAPGRARRSLQLDPQSEPQTLHVRLPFAVPLQVTVRDELGQPISDATVLVQGSDPLPHGSLTSSQGIASFAGLDERIESIQVHARGYEPSVVKGTSRDVAVVLNAPAALTVSVLDPTGGAVAGAEVWFGGLDIWPPRQVVTGSDGVAQLTGLMHGSYDLRARLGDRVSKALVGVTLARGEQASVSLTLSAGRFVAVRVTDASRADAAPIADAEVVLVEDGLGPFPLQGRTDESGRVRLGPLPASPAVLNARADGFVAQNGVAVARHAEGEVQIALVRAGRLLGQVVDAGGTPIQGARLEIVGNDLQGRPIARHSGTLSLLAPRETQSAEVSPLLVPMGELGVLSGPLPRPGAPPQGLGPSVLDPSLAWMSDRDGQFRLEDVPPGRVQLLVHHSDFVEALTEAVTLAPGGEARLRVLLERGAAVEGRLIDEAGHPVVKARVDAVTPRGTEQRSVLTGSDGRFSFGAVSNEVDLFVSRPEDRHRFVLRKSLELTAGEQREIELVLPPERAAVGVRVSGDDGRPVRGAQISLASTNPEVPLRQTAYSDEAGQVVLTDAAGMRGTLRVEAAGWRSFEAHLEATSERVEVTLERGVGVLGRITHVRGRQGLAGARVVLIQDSERQSTMSDADGEYRFLDAAVGAASVSVSHPDFAAEAFDVTIVATGRADRPFELEPIELAEAGSVSGTVLDEAGDPVAGARVGVGFVPAFLPAGAMPSGMVQTNQAGRFELSGVRVGRVTLSAYAASAGRGSVADVEVLAGQGTSDVEIVCHGGKLDPIASALADVAITLGEQSVAGRSLVVIVDVAAGSEAERAGLRARDILQSVDGAAVPSMTEARRRLGGADGSDVVVELERDGEPLSLRVRRQQVRR